MKLKLPFALSVFCLAALAQVPTQGTQQAAPVPEPGRPAPAQAPFMPGAPGAATAGGAPITLNFPGALQRAQQYSQQVLAANYAALLAREDVVQARAALLPTPSVFNQFIYTQPNDTPSGIFVSNDGPHVYNQWMVVHGDIYSPGKIADYRRTIAAEAVARARYEIATRGLIAVVVQNYYGMLAAQRKVTSAQQAVTDAAAFLDITRKQEAGGEVAHADVVKAELQLEQRRADLANAQLDLEKARINFSVILFPNYGQVYTLIDDLESGSALPPLSEIHRMAATNNPDIRAAQAAVQEQTYEIKASRALLYPSLSFDYFYGINANQYALHNEQGKNLLGSVAQAQLTIPVWTWGATRSKIRQSEIRLRQARTDLSLTQRQLLANLDAYYAEANTARNLVDSLRRSVTLAEENLRLTNLRYQAGEATALEVVDAQTTLAQARNALADGLLRYRLALANLQSLTGAF
jgi:outer membrane protein TolC